MEETPNHQLYTGQKCVHETLECRKFSLPGRTKLALRLIAKLLTQYYSYIKIKSTIFAKIDFLVQKVVFKHIERAKPMIRHG